MDGNFGVHGDQRRVFDNLNDSYISVEEIFSLVEYANIRNMLLDDDNYEICKLFGLLKIEMLKEVAAPEYLE